MSERDMLDLSLSILGGGIAFLIGFMGWIIKSIWRENIQTRLMLSTLQAHMENLKDRFEELTRQIRRLEEAFYFPEDHKKG